MSMTGIMDNRLMSGQLGMDKLESALDEVKQAAIKANAEMAAELGFPAAAAVTCVKPSGTVSQLCDSASGIHPRHSEYYIRRVRCNKDDPLTNFMLQVSCGWGSVAWLWECVICLKHLVLLEAVLWLKAHVLPALCRCACPGALVLTCLLCRFLPCSASAPALFCTCSTVCPVRTA